MKKVLIIILLSIIGNTQAQSNCHIKNYWQKMFILDTGIYKQKLNYYITVKQLPDKNKCARRINAHKLELEYIRTNFIKIKDKKEIFNKIPDSVMRQQKLINLLKKDSLFMQTITNLGDAWEHNYQKDTISIHTLMDIAAHFFYLDRQQANGAVGGHICSGFNALNGWQTKRKPLIETFVYKTVIENFTGKTNHEKYNMRDEYYKALKEIAQIDWGEVNDKRLHLLQGAMVMYMFHNKALKSLIKDAYEQQKDSLTFVLKKE